MKAKDLAELLLLDPEKSVYIKCFPMEQDSDLYMPVQNIRKLEFRDAEVLELGNWYDEK